MKGRGLEMIGLAGVLLTGCSSMSPQAGGSMDVPGGQTSTPQALSQRAIRNYGSALLVKPSGTAAVNPAYPLAPWLLLEEPGAKGRLPGSLSWAGPAPTAIRTNTTLYFSSSAAVIQGSPHAQLAYVWVHPGPEPLWQGVKMTLNSSGAPVIWEVLRDQSGVRTFYVANSLEDTALTQYGPPLPGRNFAVEQSTNTASGAQVVRIIEDGPVPMGPMVYLEQDLDISSVICRCMPAQSTNLTGAVTYEMESGDPLTASPQATASWFSGSYEQILRLPSGF